MVSLANQKFEPMAILLAVAPTIGIAALSIAFPEVMPWGFLALVAGAVLVYWVARWDVMVLTWLWVASYGLLDFDPWKIPIPGFFVLSPPRIIFLVAVLAYLLSFLVRGEPVRFDRKIFWLLLAVVVYFGINAHVAGWTSGVARYRTAPYFRYIGSVLMPFVMLWLVYNGTRAEHHAAWPFILASAYGWYALYLGYLQFAWINGAEWAPALIWPKYITDPMHGIHVARGRGAFRGAGAQATFLVMLFYMNLYSMRHVRGAHRMALIVQTVMIPPAIFFTGIRAGYVSFLVCGVVWCLWGARMRMGKLKLAAITLLLIGATMALWPYLSGTERKRGGVAQMGPVRARQILAAQAWQTLQSHPWFGVGFGHWVEYQVQMKRDPATLAGMPLFMVSQHNLFLTVVSETGVIGLVAMVAIFVAAFRHSLFLWGKLPPTASGWLSREFLVVYWVMMLNFLVQAQFRDLLWEIGSCGMLWCMSGLIIGFNRLLEPQPTGIPPAQGVWR